MGTGALPGSSRRRSAASQAPPARVVVVGPLRARVRDRGGPRAGSAVVVGARPPLPDADAPRARRGPAGHRAGRDPRGHRGRRLARGPRRGRRGGPGGGLRVPDARAQRATPAPRTPAAPARAHRRAPRAPVGVTVHEPAPRDGRSQDRRRRRGAHAAGRGPVRRAAAPVPRLGRGDHRRQGLGAAHARGGLRRPRRALPHPLDRPGPAGRGRHHRPARPHPDPSEVLP